jgi:type II secretory ATPase GspE/PulE/Tfp pilus assembly ATPase PilB-like protein
MIYSGIEQKQIADVFIGGIEQTLEGKTHKKCKGKGCSGCNGLGYKGMEAKMNFVWSLPKD